MRGMQRTRMVNKFYKKKEVFQMKNVISAKKHRGFSLIELVIVVAIIGILALMIIPQFNNVTKDAKIKTFEGNCQMVVSAYAMYQAGNNGELPDAPEDLDPYINGGFDSLVDAPKGATYDIDANGVFTASYTDDDHHDHAFTYPTNAEEGGSGEGGDGE